LFLIVLYAAIAVIGVLQQEYIYILKSGHSKTPCSAEIKSGTFFVKEKQLPL
jgi:hypothetical protein